MSADRIGQAMVESARYADLYRRGDMALAGQSRRTIEELIGQFGDGVFQLPRPVALAMGRRDLGPLYEIWSGAFAGRLTCISAHYTREAADTALTEEQRRHASYLVELRDGRTGRAVQS